MYKLLQTTRWQEFGACYCSMLFAGAALYINLAQHPAALECGTKTAATFFPPMYKRAAALQIKLALGSTVLGITSYYLAKRDGRTGSHGWLAGAVTIFSVIPFTYAAIMGTNKQLLQEGRDKESEETQSLLSKWGPLHAVRTGLSLLASAFFLITIAKSK